MTSRGGYWVLHHVSYCPICGKEDVWRERIRDRPKPSAPNERWLVEQVYDYCDVL